MRFFERAAKVVDIPWSIAAGNDLRMPEAVGPRSAQVKFINWYMAKLHRLAHRDAEASLKFHRVGNLLASPSSLMHPKLALRAMLEGLPTATLNGGAETQRFRRHESGAVPESTR
jgi:hypothetical protein